MFREVILLAGETAVKKAQVLTNGHLVKMMSFAGRHYGSVGGKSSDGDTEATVRLDGLNTSSTPSLALLIQKRWTSGPNVPSPA